MYLSRVELDVYNREKMRDLTHVGAYHNWVETSFLQEFEEGRKSRKLWRLDRLQGKDYLLLVTEEKPEVSGLERYGVEGTACIKNYDGFLNRINVGMKARFRIVLNPVVAIHEEKGKRGKVVPHVTEKQQRDFLLNRANKNGFAIEEDRFEIVERTMVLLRKKANRNIRLAKAVYEGELEVTDKVVFTDTLKHGFGREKAYGFGLMTIIPIG